MTSYQDYELDAYFGGFIDDYKLQADEMLSQYDWDVIVNSMDDEIREDLHNAISPCDDATFLLWYIARHTEKYGEDFSTCF